MRTVRYANQFKKDVKLAIKRGYKIAQLYEVMKALENGESLDSRYKEHSLIGTYNGYL